jgi:hypothetical protein
MMAPVRARRFPCIDLLLRIIEIGGQTRLDCQVHKSLNPIREPPKVASNNPHKIFLESDSCKKNGDNNATHIGAVDTRTTELATLVYSRDVIQVAKWSARNIPESNPSNNSFLVRAINSSLCRMIAIGAIIRLAIVSRNAAMTREGASSWANLIKSDAVDTDMIASMIAKGRNRGERCSTIFSPAGLRSTN